VQPAVELEERPGVGRERVCARRARDPGDEGVVPEARVGAIEVLDAGVDGRDDPGTQRLDGVDLPLGADGLEAVLSWQRRP
jgi:hypothetical protein